jgi:CPA2 family monovalent cation:H+ antiporter-2
VSPTLLLEVGGLLAGLVLAALVARRTGQSPIPFFILLGLFLNPPREAWEVVEFMATLGISLLLFLIGLEFSPASLVRGTRRVAAAGALDLALNLGLGAVAGRLLGLSWTGSFFMGGVLYVSSSGIIARGIIETGRSANRETEPLLGILVVEDIVVGVLLALLSGQAQGAPGWAAGALGLAKLVLLCAALFGAARLLRRLFWRILGTDSSEVLVLFLFAFLLLGAGASASLGLSHALGAFLAGAIVGQMPYRQRVEEILLPFQQVFAAMFFIAFGITIDRGQLGTALMPAALLLVVFTATKVATGLSIGRRWGLSPRGRWRLGLSLTPRGEFSILLATAASTLGDEGARLAVLAGAYVFLSAVTGSLLLHHADRLALLFTRPRTSEG